MVIGALVLPFLLLPSTARAAGSDLPADGPPALYAAETALPAPAGWPGPESFPRTSGSGRLAGGALLWTDWLFDDHGANGVPLNDLPVTAGSPSFGSYGYAAASAHGNGADIFRSGVALRGGDSYWRVDWTTLADPTVPVAEWTFDRDNNAATGVSTWAGAAGVTSPGIDTALVVSSLGARLLDLASGAVLSTLPVAADTLAGSFVVKVPGTVLRPTGSWRIRLAAGLANATGDGFAPATGALPGQTAVYNVTFRSRAQEPISNSFWDDMTQTSALTTGNVAAFSQLVRWSDLSARKTTAEEHPTGWSTRWYASSIKLGDGLLTTPASLNDSAANFLGRLQPYSVYVPTGVSGRLPLTFLLHSLTQNHNQYAATTPNFTQQACEARHSLCVTTLGRGPDGQYYGPAQLDFWQVWHAVAQTLPLDPERTLLSGYSMGGLGSNAIAMAHPDLFSKVVTLAGSVGAVVELENLRELPVYLAGGAADELVPAPIQKAQADALAALGYRYRWLLYPAEDHVAFELQDGFADAALYMGNARRAVNPARVTLRWAAKDTGPTYNPATGVLTGTAISTTQRPDLGVGTTGAYWMRSLKARPGAAYGRVDATSAALPDPAVVTHRSQSLLLPGTPTPAVVTEQTWSVGASKALRSRVSLDLTGLSSAAVLLHDAGLPSTGCSTVSLVSDGRTALTLVGTDSSVTTSAPKGSSVLTVLNAGSRPSIGRCRTGVHRSVDFVPMLPTTGGSLAAAVLGVLVLVGAAGLRHRRSSTP
jgi:poly(3-hydroxybutyrate) depolymerase